MSTINGRKPVSSKPKARPLSMDDIFGGAFNIDAAMKKVVENNGMACRFISYTKLQSMGGYHERGWTPLTKQQLKEWGYDTMNSVLSFTPDNFIRRGDCILAIRSKDLNEKHKAYLKQEAASKQNIQARHADELREHIRAAGIDKYATVDEGYGSEE